MVLDIDKLQIAEITEDRAAICESILSALPEWFGIPSATASYVAHASGAPMICARCDSTPVAFVSLAEHFGLNCEIHSMGVLPQLHRKGIGRALIEAAAARARGAGYRYLTVKTLADLHPDPNYASTRAFYMSTGFKPLEEFRELWGTDLPCLMLIRPI